MLDSELDGAVPQVDPLMSSSNSRDGGPLTLSQPSPRKLTQESSGHSGEPAASPMRPAVKRPSPLAAAAGVEDGGVRSKKRVVSAGVGVGLPSTAAAESAIVARPPRVRTVSAPVHAVRKQPVRKPSEGPGKPARATQRAVSSTSSSTASSKSSSTVLPRTAVVSAAPKIRELPDASSASSSSSSVATHSTRKVPTPTTTSQSQESRSSTGTSRDAARHFRVNDSSEDSSQQQTNAKPYKIPDFKSMHASLAAQGALRRSQLAPTVPVPLAFSTDMRARERELFDEKVREKEREVEVAREVQWREREEEEMRERDYGVAEKGCA
ncbi:hypothetical protein R3P38DRAFT_3179874 [Favolaschia claudopus]|uniref:TPX2 C-terminal domain-containing protein n=1 Tax=Favolaschia claudopus TaxID=2862362 RepID=A0AAW0CR18_9AGAR